MKTITKRNGTVTPFEPERIRKAIHAAFWEHQNQKLKAEGKPLAPKGAPLIPEIETEIDTTTRLVVETADRKNLTTVEEIESLVEDTIWSREHKDVSKLYIGYRLLHQKKREESELKYKISITKSTGEKVPFQIEPLEAAIKAACHGIPDVSEKALLSEAENSLYDGVKTSEITEAMIQAARSFIEREPAYSYVASRLLLQKLADESLGELGFDYQSSQIPVSYNEYFQAAIARGVEEKLLDPRLASEFDLDKLAKAIVPERDLELQYMGLKTLADRYLIKSRKSRNRIELPQNFFMRVAMGLALNETEKNERAIEFYNVLSQRLGMSSTPTLFNAGTLHPQLSSCYLLTVGDNIESIFKNYSDNARLSKWAGGIGNDWSAVRGHGAYIGGTNGESQGGVPWWKITNGVACAVNQGSKRKGAICNYLETWHIDIEEFLELRKETGDDRRRCHDMNTANWIPDLFMKRVIEDGQWWLFSPDKTPELHSLYGKAFEKRYIEYEALAEAGEVYDTNHEIGMVKISKQGHDLHPCKRVSAVALWKKMLAALFETGHPWITFKDAGNIRNPQDHMGVIHSSNLCTEIFLNTSVSKVDSETGTITEMGETAVCNLASINLVNHLREGKLDKNLLRSTVITLMRMLDNVIDINFYPIPEARASNYKHRPVGLGVMGVHTTLQELGIPYDSEEAIEFCDVSQEMISLFAIEGSSDLAAEKGQYESFPGSKWDRGIFPKDTLELLAEERGSEYMTADTSSAFPEEWTRIKAKVQRQGMRNSNTMAIAPTATIANICGVSEGIMPERAPVSKKENLSGTFPIINPLLIQKLKKNSLWETAILDKIKMSEGSIQTITEIPEEIRNLFKTSMEIHPTFLIECASRRQKWIDQGQSLNLFADQPDGQYLSNMYRLAWMKGLKSTYYLRSVSSSQKEKASVEVQNLGNTTGSGKKTFTQDEVKACSIEAMRNGEECEACQ